MWSKLSDLFTSLQKGTLKNVLTGAGLMLGSNAIFLTAFSAAVNVLKNSVGSFSRFRHCNVFNSWRYRHTFNPKFAKANVEKSIATKRHPHPSSRRLARVRCGV